MSRPKRRLLFLSCSNLMRFHDKIPKDILRDSLFFFGSKERWIFPQTPEEVAEANKQPGRYGRMPPSLRALIAEKLKKGHAHFLKKPSLKYTHYPGPDDPKAYSRASKWFEKLGYGKLRLDRKWWKEESGRSKRVVYRVVNNFERGLHEYNEVIELITASFGCHLKPVLGWASGEAKEATKWLAASSSSATAAAAADTAALPPSPPSTVFDERTLKEQSSKYAQRVMATMMNKTSKPMTIPYDGIRTVGKDLTDAKKRAGSSDRKKTTDIIDAFVDGVVGRIVSRKFEVATLGKDTKSLKTFSHFSRVSESEIRPVLCALIAEGRGTPSALARAVGALVGLAVADAVGHWTEFMDCVDRPGDAKTLFNVDYLEFAPPIFNKFNLRPGQWTDDTAMSLCMADSLITRGRFDGSDMRVRFWTWWTQGYANAFRNEPKRFKSVGLGGNIASSLHVLEPGKTPPPRVSTNSEDSGNGSLMRLAPIALYYSAAAAPGASDRSRDALLRAASLSSLTTHPGKHASEACAFLAFLVARAIRDARPHVPASGGIDMRTWLDESVGAYLRDVLPKRGDGSGVGVMKRLLESKESSTSLERNWNWKSPSLEILSTLERRVASSAGGTYNGHPVSRGYFGAYCMDGLAVALHALYYTSSYGAALERCVNFLGDADSTGAIVGQIAGAFYGVADIDSRLLERLMEWDNGEIALRAVLLHVLGEKADEKGDVAYDKEDAVGDGTKVGEDKAASATT